MNKITIWLILAFITIFNCDIIAQPRVNKEISFKQMAESGIIENPVGWCLDKTVGKWCGYYGVLINDYKNNSTKPLQVSIAQRSQLTNISSMQFKKYDVGEDIYYALYIVDYKCYYDYPEIYQGLHSYKDCKIYLFTEEEYQKLYDLKEGFNKIHTFTFVNTNFDHKYGTNSGKLYINNRLEEIFYDMKNDEQYRYNRLHKPNFGDNWYIKVEEDNTIRFILPTTKYLWEEAQQINKDNEKKSGYIPIRQYNCIDFSDEYFEVTKAQFDKLLIK